MIVEIYKKLFFVIIFFANISTSAYATTQSPISLNTENLTQFYQYTEQSVWLKQQQPTKQAYDALDFISASALHGLSPEKYHYSLLKKLDPSQDLQSSTQFEQLLTDGLLKLISDINIGQFNTQEADPDWFIPQRSINQVSFLQQALLTINFKQTLNSLAPNTKEYHALMQALSHYKSYVGRGGWNTITIMPLMHVGESHAQIPAVRARLSYEQHLTFSSSKKPTNYDPLLEQAVKDFQARHGLKTDGIIGNNTRKAMNVSAQQRVQQIKVALERQRWLPKDLGTRYLMINLANYTLTAVDNNDEKLNMRVIVGRKSRPTPSFSARLNHLVFNPYWNVPKKLARLDLLPKQQADLNYFYLHDIRVFTYEDGHKIEHEPYTINWQSITKYNFPYTFRQDPGEHNALGKLKFMFQNPWGIYLHDTSHRELFNEDSRSFSSGCIRVEDPISLANFSLTSTSEEVVLELLESKENKGLKLTNSLIIYTVYSTVWFKEGQIIFSPDVYQRDQRLASLL